MPTTAQRLYDSCVKCEPLSLPVLTDYFGNATQSENEDDLTIVFAVCIWVWFSKVCRLSCCTTACLPTGWTSWCMQSISATQAMPTLQSATRSWTWLIGFLLAHCLKNNGWISMTMIIVPSAIRLATWHKENGRRCPIVWSHHGLAWSAAHDYSPGEISPWLIQVYDVYSFSRVIWKYDSPLSLHHSVVPCPCQQA